MPPIATLPEELLHSIFESIIRDEAPFFPSPVFPSYNVMSTPYRLAQVCQMWRALCLASPLLWSNIAYLLKDTDESSLAALHTRLSLTLDRSQEVPLAVVVHVLWLSYDKFDQHLEKIHSTILATTHRWASLSFSMASSSTAHIEFLQNLRGSHFAILSSLDTYTVHADGVVYDPPVPKSPFLSRIRASTIQYCELPWSQLEWLRTNHDLIVLSAIRECPRLKSLLVDGEMDKTPRFVGPLDPFTNHSITHLHLPYMTSRSFARSFKFPALRRLSQGHSDANPNSGYLLDPSGSHFMRDVILPITESSPNLRAIEVVLPAGYSRNYVSQYHLRNLFCSTFSRLTELSLIQYLGCGDIREDYNTVRYILLSLSLTNTHVPLPNLHHLTLGFRFRRSRTLRDPLDYADHPSSLILSFQHLVMARSNLTLTKTFGSCRLKTFRLLYCPHFSVVQDLAPILLALRSKELAISVEQYWTS